VCGPFYRRFVGTTIYQSVCIIIRAAVFYTQITIRRDRERKRKGSIALPDPLNTNFSYLQPRAEFPLHHAGGVHSAHRPQDVKKLCRGRRVSVSRLPQVNDVFCGTRFCGKVRDVSAKKVFGTLKCEKIYIFLNLVEFCV